MPISRRALLGLERRAADGAAAERRDSWVRVYRRIMACRFEVVLPAEEARHLEAARRALDEADRLEAQLSLFRPESDLAHVNREAHLHPVEAGAALFDLLVRSRDLHAATEGAFDVTSTPLSRCWGFLARAGRKPSDEEIAEARARVGLERVTLDAARRAVRFDRPGIELNLGSIGKGYAVDRMAGILRAAGIRRALISAGRSSMLALGGGWPIDIRSPLADRPIARLHLSDAALGTSGPGRQFVEIEGVRYGHVIDPRSGRPARGILSASVICDAATDADALSTAFLVGGPDLAARYCAAHPRTLALIVLDDAERTVRSAGAHPGVAIASR
ncbi:MAG TPA: FAD:protein FMN transferase [Vicinamibacterales bacterium]|nr:FAD:protein FMN transferase [Vicinamibacterales bacterium]